MCARNGLIHAKVEDDTMDLECSEEDHKTGKASYFGIKVIFGVVQVFVPYLVSGHV